MTDAVRTTCPYCGVGCGVLATPEGAVRGDPGHPANLGRLCSKGTVLGAHAVVRGDIPEYSVAVGTPARVVRNRVADYEADAQRRAAVADMSRKAAEALQESLRSQTS